MLEVPQHPARPGHLGCLHRRARPARGRPGPGPGLDRPGGGRPHAGRHLRPEPGPGLGRFREALRDFHSPQQNIVYADAAGNVGFLAPGRVPLRRAGDGTAPVEGWSGSFDWVGELAFEDLPQALNPAQGPIVSGNNRSCPKATPTS